MTSATPYASLPQTPKHRSRQPLSTTNVCCLLYRSHMSRPSTNRATKQIDTDHNRDTRTLNHHRANV